jgi:biotin synthase
MGNFLTTLGNEPEQDREMFQELGLNVARQPDNAANPRPDNRSQWLAGETPNVLEQSLDAEPRAPVDLGVRMWDPSTQLRYRAKRAVPPRPDGAPNRVPVG